jgi:hypothetical protein
MYLIGLPQFGQTLGALNCGGGGEDMLSSNSSPGFQVIARTPPIIANKSPKVVVTPGSEATTYAKAPGI